MYFNVRFGQDLYNLGAVGGQNNFRALTEKNAGAEVDIEDLIYNDFQFLGEPPPFFF